MAPLAGDRLADWSPGRINRRNRHRTQVDKMSTTDAPTRSWIVMTRIAGACFATAALCTVAACGGGGGGSGGGFGTSSVTAASVSTVPGPTLSFTADADTVNSGASVSLSWSSQDADSCSAAGGWSGPRSVSGTATVGTVREIVQLMPPASRRAPRDRAARPRGACRRRRRARGPHRGWRA